jgi:tRNA modification GTPase
MTDILDSICALSTPPGRSGIAVIRLSGIGCHEIVEKIFTPKKKRENSEPRLAIFGKIIDAEVGAAIDEGVVTCFCAPNSYTGEDMAEFSIHGNPAIISAILDTLKYLGARLAEPGEFTMRAFLNGKMDLTQAEAVHDIIAAKTLFQAQTAGRQRSGQLAENIRSIKEILLDIVVNLESAIEFEEEDLQADSKNSIDLRIEDTRSKIGQWIDSYRKGRVINDGIRMAVIGRPNVGKSSLFNKLLAQNRSIVSDIPGTTRDTISEDMSMEGIPVHLLDTAGIHNSENIIEAMGMEKSRQAISDADAILFVVDGSQKAAQQDFIIKGQIPISNCIVILNKCDLPHRWSNEDKRKFCGDWKFLEVSAKTGKGIKELQDMMLDNILGEKGLQFDGVLITNLRHYHALENAEKHLEKAAIASRNRLSEEFVLMDLHKSLECLGEITGETNIEDLLTAIFSKFCIGK